MAADVRSLYFCHFCRYTADAALLREIADGFAAVVAGDVAWQRNRDCIGFPVREARFARFSIFVADDGANGRTPC
jgi:hypothetical protein